MNPDPELRIVAALADFILKTTLAFGFCLVFSRLVHSPTRRLAAWLSFLFGASGYWFWLARNVFKASRSAADASPRVFPPAAPTVSVWHLQGSWALPLGIAIRVAGIVYVTVLLYLFCNHLKKWLRLRWVMKFTTSAPLEIEERFQILADDLGVGRSRLRVLSGVSSPATFGCIRPTVLLPEVCLQQNAPDLDDILLHELHHVRRSDFVWNRLAMLCRALVFFQPACWYALRRVNLERELACDLAVIAQIPGRRATYAECLIRFARLHEAQEQKAWGVDFAASQHLKARVHSILAGSKKPSVWSVCMRTACGVTLLAGFVGLVPSLAVLLSYTQQQVAPPLNPGMNESLPATKGRRVNDRRSKALPVPRPAGPRSGSLSPGELSEPAQPAQNATNATGVTTSQSGPQLLHRPSPGTAATGNAKQQTVALIDPDAAGRGSKAADRKQAVEQTATTALGIYRQLGAVDRH